MSRLLALAASALVILVGLNGCAGFRQSKLSPMEVSGPELGRIFCADGAGGLPVTTNALRNAIAEAGLPLQVEMVRWSHGRLRNLADEADYSYARAQGACLAEAILTYRGANPDREVFLAAHSAGSAVVLAALETLPANTVERVLLLAPAVSAAYDLRCALRATRHGIDVFYSRRDRLYLGLATRVVGTADRRRTAAAGRVGFRPVVASPEDEALYARLRLHPWTPDVAWTGNRGGHFDSYKPGYLRAFIVPLLAGDLRLAACATAWPR